jgi:hypothetical protein
LHDANNPLFKENSQNKIFSESCSKTMPDKENRDVCGSSTTFQYISKTSHIHYDKHLQRSFLTEVKHEISSVLAPEFLGIRSSCSFYDFEILFLMFPHQNKPIMVIMSGGVSRNEISGVWQRIAEIIISNLDFARSAIVFTSFLNTRDSPWRLVSTAM